MTQYTQEDLIKARNKAAKALEKLDRIVDDMKPDYDWSNYFGETAMEFAEELHMPHFIDSFKPERFKVTVWIARPYFVEVDAMDEEDAINKVHERLDEHDDNDFTPDHSTFVESLAVNVLTTSPFQMVAEQVED